MPSPLASLRLMSFLRAIFTTRFLCPFVFCQRFLPELFDGLSLSEFCSQGLKLTPLGSLELGFTFSNLTIVQFVMLITEGILV